MIDFYPPVGFYFDVRVFDSLDMATSVATSSSSGSVPNVDGSFQDVSGISVELDTEEYREGGENRFIYRLPSYSKYSNLVMKRGLITAGSLLSTWCQTTLQSEFPRIIKKNLLVSLLNEEGLPLMVWSFIGAYPIKWEVANLSAMENKILTETLEFTYLRFEPLNVNNAMGKVTPDASSKLNGSIKGIVG